MARKSVVAVIRKVGRINAFNVVIATRPVAQIDHLTPFTAKGTKFIFMPSSWLLAGRTFNGKFIICFFHRDEHHNSDTIERYKMISEALHAKTMNFSIPE